MGQNITTIGFDADDTLWHNERFFRQTQEQFTALLADYADPAHLDERLLAAERRNIGRYGFGVKGFTLSMIETAIEVTDERIPARVIAQLIEAGRDMLAHPIELLPHAAEVVEAVSASHRVVLITKGDLLHQERKLAQSGLGDHFDAVEIVSEKTPGLYARIFDDHGDGADKGLMVGNSMRSDVVPMIEAGGWGVYVPHDLEWDLEKATRPRGSRRFYELITLGALPELVMKIG